MRAEICQEHLVEPATVGPLLPRGRRLVTLREQARVNRHHQDVLARAPELADHGMGSLCFVNAASDLVEGAPATDGDTVTMAFWWVQVAPAGDAPDDRRAPGDVADVQLASWYPRAGVDRKLIVAADPMAEFVDLAVERRGENGWRVRLGLPEGRVEGSVQAAGKRTAMRASAAPSFMTVWGRGAHADTFTVCTYFGHHEQTADGRWPAEGPHPLARSLERHGTAIGLPTRIQDGWQALSGVCRAAR